MNTYDVVLLGHYTKDTIISAAVLELWTEVPLTTAPTPQRAWG